MARLELVVPDSDTSIKFEKRVEPVLSCIINLAKLNANLHKTRELLVPRLLFRELSTFTTLLFQVFPAVKWDRWMNPTRKRQRSNAHAVANKDAPQSEKAISATLDVTMSTARAQQYPGKIIEVPLPIDQTDRSDALAAIRQVFSDGKPRTRENAIRDVARVLGYGHVRSSNPRCASH